ncbi:MAG: DNA circularization N-terminal domain-containing protein [Oscillospiraceae bacterium]|nr:DNA circularization N-terminal domain-containing protein [Oscillospiraceae bacterium]
MNMKFKDYVWPNNPQTYQEVLHREPLYVTKDGVTSYSKMSTTGRVITGSGAFFGQTAYEDIRELVTLAEDTTPGELIHPVLGIRYCYLTKLEVSQEPREEFISYSFEFIQAKEDGTVPR